jgi:hypothetical protein
MWNKLPDELIFKILSYSYNTQSHELLQDVRSYYLSKKIADRFYYKLWIETMHQPSFEDRNWLINDLGFVIDSFRFRNIYMLRNHSNNQLNDIVVRLSKRPVNFQINIYWGLMSTEDRSRFIKIYTALII